MNRVDHAAATALAKPAFFQRLLWPAFGASLIAAAAASVVQQVFLVPLILRAELIEAGGAAEHAAGAAVHAGIDRIAYTLLFNWLTAFGYALLLAVCLTRMRRTSWRRGLLWGLAGFASFALAPALGLPPELPGSHAADLVARQGWWIATALATAAGLACVFLNDKRLIQLSGIALIALPHLVGAPAIPPANDPLPADMRHAFAIGSLAQSLLLWLLLGGFTAAFMTRLAQRATPDCAEHG